MEYPLRCLRLRRHQLQTQAAKSADLRSSSSLPQYTLTPRFFFPLLGQVHRSSFHQNIFHPWDESTTFFRTPRIVSTMNRYTLATNRLAFWAEILTSERILEKGDSTCTRGKHEQESCVEVFDLSSTNLCLLWLNHQPRCGSGRAGYSGAWLLTYNIMFCFEMPVGCRMALAIIPQRTQKFASRCGTTVPHVSPPCIPWHGCHNSFEPIRK